MSDTGIVWLDDIFDRDWKAFVKTIRQENARSNRRLYKILTEIKGKSFVQSLDKIAKKLGGLPKIRVAREPKGILLKDNRYSGITEMWIDQKQTEEGATGQIYIQVKENRWVTFHY